MSRRNVAYGSVIGAFVIAVVLIFLLAGCGDKAPPRSPQPPVTIADPLAYLAQSRHCDGNPTTPLRIDDAILCRRYDIFDGRKADQARDSFLVPGGARTTWSYAPFGPYSTRPDGYGAHGDGGDEIAFDGESARITHTRDGGTPRDQRHPVPWTIATNRTATCPDWTVYSLMERGCRATVTYPLIGPVDTIVSEHGDGNATERFFQGRGWGGIAWQSFSSTIPPIWDLAQRCPDFGGWNHPPRDGQRLVTCRVSVFVEPADGALTGAQLWAPGR